ncbi:PhzF family phenazine biosynthesis protein [Burkholderia pseudomultivorans]|uniref:PhzF family phenazine biosynthesis protein n=1 Tax=Burkholderia pseudomultivorans TaxID=1207504 RepID=UPI0009BEAF14|nr:PhzF family phenazine biosynthesis protein [Burkholderia pseudomultivorans]
MNREITLPIWQVDAFSSQTFGGNPAAVVALSGDWLPDDVLQAIAAENNLSETAFVRLGEHPVPLRWFTPRCEVPLCGHATLATIAILHEMIGCVGAGATIEIASASGVLRVTVDRKGYVLDFPSRLSVPSSVSKAELEDVLDCEINEVWESIDRYVCVLSSEAAVRAVSVNVGLASALRLPGVIATAPGDDCDFVSRYFAPAKGVPEDPVTGTSHCTLAPFWGRRLGKTQLLARQLSARGGEIHCSVDGDRVRLTGECKIYLQGSITIPASDQ